MKVLWIVNILMPELRGLMFGASDLKESGGWLVGAANEIKKYEGISLSIATVSNKVADLKVYKGENIDYFVFPEGKSKDRYQKKYEEYWLKVREICSPDIIHIHGTEYTHGLAYVNACGSKGVLVSIQGLKSAICKHYCDGITRWELYKNLTFHDLIKGTAFSEKHSFKKTGELEIKLLQSVSCVAGRTTWDRAKCQSINPRARYFLCNETLRPTFYTGERWAYEKCKRHSIFISQANYPIKGLHVLLKALYIVKDYYPDTVLNVAGKDIVHRNNWRDYLHYTSYGKYLFNEIKALKLNVQFLGQLDAVKMKEELLRSNLYICPSSIENSPNSIGEAQMLGVPCLASFVGGVPDLMSEMSDNLYRFDDYDILAYKICSIFEQKGRQKECVEIAKLRHDPENNAQALMKIYEEMYKNCM